MSIHSIAIPLPPHNSIKNIYLLITKIEKYILCGKLHMPCAKYTKLTFNRLQSKGLKAKVNLGNRKKLSQGVFKKDAV